MSRTWSMQNSLFIGDTLIYNREIIPSDVYSSSSVQEAYSLDEKLNDQNQAVNKIINDVLRYFREVRVIRNDLVTKMNFFYRDDRSELLDKIDKLVDSLVPIESLIEHFRLIKARLNLDERPNLSESENDTLGRYNYLKNNLESNKIAMKNAKTRIAEIGDKLSELAEISKTTTDKL